MDVSQHELLNLNFDDCRLAPYNHQKDGCRFMLSNRYCGLFDEMGAGKTKQVIDTAMMLFRMGLIDTVLIVTPAAVRRVWCHQEYGELKKHLWHTLPSKVVEFHRKVVTWHHGPKPGIDVGSAQPQYPVPLEFIVTNYDWIRDEDRLAILADSCGKRTWLVLDESSYVKNHKAKQTKACMELRKRCGRATLLNGTPIANSPGDMYAQGQLINKEILDCKNWFVFRARYAVLGGFKGKVIVEWKNLQDLQNRFAPHVIRRLKKDCLDLPEKLPPVIIPVRLKPVTWRLYKEMEADLITWLDANRSASALTAAVKAMRLAQITSGFVGGVLQNPSAPDESTPAPAFLDELKFDQPFDHFEKPNEIAWPDDAMFDVVTQVIGSEKLDAFLEWLDDKLDIDPNFKVLVWCRFRPELDRVVAAVRSRVKHVGQIHGGIKQKDRDTAIMLLDPATAPQESVVVVGTPQTGRTGLNLTATCTVVYISNDFSLFTRLQSEDRVHRPGQKFDVSYFDMIAEGPNGEPTVDHHIVASLHTKEDVASWTTDAWRVRLAA